jgi:hypothetical protein
MHRITTRASIVAAGWALALAGCTHHYQINFGQVDRFDEFEWTGDVKVTTTEGGIFESARITRLVMKGKDGRTFLIEPEGWAVRAYVEVPAKEVACPTTQEAPREVIEIKTNKN